MDVGGTRGMREQWIWERGPLRVLVAATLLLPLVVTLALYLAVGAKAFVALVFCCMGPVFWVAYRVVGRKVEELRETLSAGESEAIASLIVDGLLQSPGITVLDSDALQLRPIAGQPVEVRWEEIKSFREVRWFNGTRLFGKTGFWIDVPGRSRLGVAMPASSATALRQRLQKHSVASGGH